VFDIITRFTFLDESKSSVLVVRIEVDLLAVMVMIIASSNIMVIVIASNNIMVIVLAFKLNLLTVIVNDHRLHSRLNRTLSFMLGSLCSSNEISNSNFSLPGSSSY
jgi:hypothetical protein